jgi:hypothetical protein
MGGGSVNADMNRMTDLFEIALASGDIDRGLELLEERRQWGENGRPADHIEEPWDLKVQAARINLRRRLQERRKNGGG